MVNKNVIEINGRIYDAQTGKAIGGATKTTESVHHKIAVTSEPATTAIASKTQHVHHKAPKKVAHPVQPTKTLMRRAVHKPVGHKAAIHHIQVTASSKAVVHKSQAIAVPASTNKKRLQRSHEVHRNHHIRHFHQIDTKLPIVRQAPSKPVPKSRSAHATVSPVQALVEQGLAKATSHTQPPVKNKRRRLSLRRHKPHYA